MGRAEGVADSWMDRSQDDVKANHNDVEAVSDEGDKTSQQTR